MYPSRITRETGDKKGCGKEDTDSISPCELSNKTLFFLLDVRAQGSRVPLFLFVWTKSGQ